MTSARVGDDRLHWNLRSIGYVRRTKEQVLPRLPSKRRDTIPLILANEQQYRLAESDVIAWLQTLPLDFKTLDAKVAAALRSEQLVRLNNLRNGLVPAGPRTNRRIDGRGTRAKAHPDRRGDGWSGARRGAAGGRGGAGAEGAAAETRSRGWDQAGADSGLGAPHSCTPPSQLGPPARVTCAPVRFEHNA
jgi:hypothetical protein